MGPSSVNAIIVLLSILVVATSLSPQHQQTKKTAAIEHGRRSFLFGGFCTVFAPSLVSAKCTDIDSCREIGDKKVEQDLKDNPITVLEDSGVRYKVLKAGFGTASVQPANFVDLIYSVSTGGGVYMYSQGFGYEKVDMGNGVLQKDSGLDSYRVTLGRGDLPVGVEQAMVGMKKGERRRIEVPPKVGFETSNWKPEPTTRNGIGRIANYKTLLNGVGSTRPAFPAPTIWDVEILSFR